jgi:hypothetical protein
MQTSASRVPGGRRSSGALRQAITTKLGVQRIAELTTLTRATRYHRRAVVNDVAVTITCSTENRVVENRP